MPGIIETKSMETLAYRPANGAETPTTTDAETNTRSNNTDPAIVNNAQYAVQPAGQGVEMGSDDPLLSLEERALRLRAKNRRKRYLEMHPEYFDDESLELANPILYDALVRRFQTTAEREAIGRSRGHVGQHYLNILGPADKEDTVGGQNPDALFAYDTPESKEEGAAWWNDEMRQRFLRGDDSDFDYKTVDDNTRYNDPEEERDIQDAWFDSMSSDYDTDGEGKEKVLTGETGIQDF
jgi:hypothetical protein